MQRLAAGPVRVKEPVSNPTKHCKHKTDGSQQPEKPENPSDSRAQTQVWSVSHHRHARGQIQTRPTQLRTQQAATPSKATSSTSPALLSMKSVSAPSMNTSCSARARSHAPSPAWFPHTQPQRFPSDRRHESRRPRRHARGPLPRRSAGPHQPRDVHALGNRPQLFDASRDRKSSTNNANRLRMGMVRNNTD